MAEIDKISSSALARRIQLRSARSHSWFAIVAATPGVLERQSFAEELSVLVPTHVRELEVATIVHDLKILQAPDDDVVLVFSSEVYGQTTWRNLDLERSRLERPGSLVFWIQNADLDELTENAPNLRSFIGNSFFANDVSSDEMSESEKEVRLGQLRRHFAKTDEDVIRQAEQGALDGSPSYTEWLLLMGREDLVR